MPQQNGFCVTDYTISSVASSIGTQDIVFHPEGNGGLIHKEFWIFMQNRDDLCTKEEPGGRKFSRMEGDVTGKQSE